MPDRFRPRRTLQWLRCGFIIINNSYQRKKKLQPTRKNKKRQKDAKKPLTGLKQCRDLQVS